MSAVLEALRRHATAMPDAAAISDGSETSSYAELHARVASIAAAIRAQGISVAAIAADNGPDWVAADLGAQAAGAALVPVPLFFSRSQAAHVLADSGAEAIIADPMGACSLDLPTLAAGGVRLTDRLDLYALPIGPANHAPGQELPAGTAKISYTSGTTGRPKGVCLAQDTMDRVASSVRRATADLEIERHLCVLPLATLLENIAGVYAPLLRGAEVVLPPLERIGFDGAARFDVVRMLDCLEHTAAGSVILLPQMLAALVAAMEAGRRVPRSLRFLAVGGARVSGALLERAERLGLPVYEGYGLTECASVVALNTPAGRRRGSVGRPLDHVGIEVGPGSEIRVRGAAMLGYLGEPGPAPSVIATRDIGHVDADGFVYIDGRRKNAFITSFGRNVSPEWVETELEQQPGIVQAALFGEARPWNVAVLVPASTDLRADELQAHVDAANALLPDYARVDQWILAHAPFTGANGLLTANGRIRRHAIWNVYADEINALYRTSQWRSA